LLKATLCPVKRLTPCGPLLLFLKFILLLFHYRRYDEGSILVKVGREEPAVSMDVAGGKLIWARHSELQQANLKALSDENLVKDGERLPLAVKDMGSCEIYPQTIAHNPNGR